MNPYLQRWQGHPEYMIRDCLIFLSAFAVLYSVALSFIHQHRHAKVTRKKRSVVDTLTMVLFFIGFSKLLTLNIGTIQSPPVLLQWPLLIAGTALTLIGSFINVAGRTQLGANWANQIKIYEKHQLQTQGIYRIVRHPLYASTIWMFLGAAVAYLNYAGFLATCIIFIPAMYYRAKQEETLLMERFPEYEGYRQSIGMFFPKLFSKKESL